MTTTTGNAAAVLDWMEEWLPDRMARAAGALHLGHRALGHDRAGRPALARGPDALAPGLAVANDSFPFMTWRDTEVAGVPARVCRISFSGELAYEINVAAWDGLAVWEALARGRRAVRHHPVRNRDDARAARREGLPDHRPGHRRHRHPPGPRAWPGSCPRRRPTSSACARSHGPTPAGPTASSSSACCRSIPTSCCPKAPSSSNPARSELPVPMLGHVTSSYRSAALGRTFALALVKSGRDRVGQTLHAALGDRTVAVAVTDPVLYDPEGTHRDG